MPSQKLKPVSKIPSRYTQCTGKPDPTFPIAFKQFYNDLVDAAHQYDVYDTDLADIHHGVNDRGNPDPYAQWIHIHQNAVRVKADNEEVLHLQIRLEHHEPTDGKRLVMFGRRVKSLKHSSTNTAHATLNSKLPEGPFLLNPKLKLQKVEELKRLLPGPDKPHYDGKVVFLGSVGAYTLLRRFLIALSAISAVKENRIKGHRLPFCGWVSDIKNTFPFDQEFHARELSQLRDILEGKLKSSKMNCRQRCKFLLSEAQEYYRSRNKDGRLHCSICTWAPPVSTRSEVIQLHHVRPLAEYSKNGLRLTMKEAILNLMPLCPNCHRILESHPNGGHYTPKDLKVAYEKSGSE